MNEVWRKAFSEKQGGKSADCQQVVAFINVLRTVTSSAEHRLPRVGVAGGMRLVMSSHTTSSPRQHGEETPTIISLTSVSSNSCTRSCTSLFPGLPGCSICDPVALSIP